ncbi:MAG TPA: hypothetical protein VGB68_08140 [Pyrinomonadaceae bacterium]|jgi:cytidylate kinase
MNPSNHVCERDFAVFGGGCFAARARYKIFLKAAAQTEASEIARREIKNE